MRISLRFIAFSLALAAWAPACGESAPTSADAAADAGVTDAPKTDAPSDSAACAVTPAGRLCVRGAVGDGGATEELVAGAAVRFQLFPKGCFSSSCSVAREARCAVGEPAGAAVALTGAFCVGSAGGGGGCTPDCNGGGFANCERALAAGTYSATLDGLTLAFTVPSSLPPGGRCVGSQF